MTTLLGILDTAGAKDEIGKDMAKDMVKKLIKPWSEEFHTEFVRLGLRTRRAEFKNLGYNLYDSMDYEPMEQMPEERNFDFRQSLVDFGRYFSDNLSKLPEIVLPGQPDENLTSIVLGKRPIWTPKGQDTTAEDSVYLCIGSGDKRPAKMHALRGNEEVSTPILYALMGNHIQILIPNNLSYAFPLLSP